MELIQSRIRSQSHGDLLAKAVACTKACIGGMRALRRSRCPHSDNNDALVTMLFVHLNMCSEPTCPIECTCLPSRMLHCFFLLHVWRRSAPNSAAPGPAGSC